MNQSVKHYTEEFLQGLVTGDYEFPEDTLIQLKQTLLLIFNNEFFEDLLEIEETDISKEFFRGIDFDEAFDLMKADKLHLISSFDFVIEIETKQSDRGGNKTENRYLYTIDENDFRFFSLGSFSGAFGTSFDQSSHTKYLSKVPDEYKAETIVDWVKIIRRSYIGSADVTFKSNLLVKELR